MILSILRRVFVGMQHAAPFPLSLIVLFLLAAPLAAQPPDRYASLPQALSLQGFPQIGYPSALVDVRVYAAFDDPASAAFWSQSADTLIQHVRNGEVRLTFIPLFGIGSIEGGRAAARASICAGEQNVFWQYVDRLFAGQTQFGAAAFGGERLLDGARQLGVAEGQWSECINSTGPDVILDDAQDSAQNEATFNTTPYVLVDDSPSLTDSASLDFTIDLLVQQANTELATQSAVEITPEATEVDHYVFDPLSHEAVAPPLTLSLPAGWSFAYDALVLQDIDGIRPVPFAFYQGPVTGGIGTIVLLWGFPNLVVGAPAGGLIQPDVWTDATRLLRLAIFEEGCNVGTDLRRNYSVGAMQAVGTQFAAVDCPQLVDTRGWFAGLRQFNVNFVFYAYTEPITAMDGAAVDELQAILDSVQFILPEVTPEPAS
ncbi:MAG: thioredoxin domain-containing protein [Chloroflexota bacterium]